MVGFSYAAMRNRTECWCGDTFNKGREVSKLDCYMNCPGNELEQCGAKRRNSVYNGE